MFNRLRNLQQVKKFFNTNFSLFAHQKPFMQSARNFSTLKNFTITSASTEEVISYIRNLQTENESLKKQIAILNNSLSNNQHLNTLSLMNEKTKKHSAHLWSIFDDIYSTNETVLLEIAYHLKYGADANYMVGTSFPLDTLVFKTDFNFETKKIADLLLSKGANINLKDKYKEQTTLHHAIELGKTDWVEYLLKNGADTTLTNLLDQTPLDIAELNKSSAMIELIKNAQLTQPEKQHHLAPKHDG